MENVIKIYNHPNHFGSTLFIHSGFLNGEDAVICNLEGEKLTIRKPDIDSILKECKINKAGKGCRFYLSKVLPEGDFPVDLEESSEDEIVIYLKRQ